MNPIELIFNEHEPFAKSMDHPDFEGANDILEGLYPDRAHFIFELLANAEDAGAKEALFVLDKQALKFQHDGRPFNAQDIRGITSIGRGTKRGQKDQIGRFGVGFKSVFIYTEEPHIWSSEFSFKISKRYLPVAIPARIGLGEKTLFSFPFRHSENEFVQPSGLAPATNENSKLKKTAHDAFIEIENGFHDLAITSLLFLRNIKRIGWNVHGRDIHEVKCVLHPNDHVEIIQSENKVVKSCSHFLRFLAPAQGMERLFVAIAFELEFIPGVEVFNPSEAISKQMRIAAANPGRVAIFFPAEKETSGLRFHLHGPFEPELSRASVKETEFNTPFFEQLALLASKALHVIKKMGLLSGETLGVLPNTHEKTVGPEYVRIRDGIINEMKKEPLVPTFSGSHAPAVRLLNPDKAQYRHMLSQQDIRILSGASEESYEWTIPTKSGSDQERFLKSLDIREWGFKSLLEGLERSNGSLENGNSILSIWLSHKSAEWHQRFYALLGRESKKDQIDIIKNLRIVRLSDGQYSTGQNAYFPQDNINKEEGFAFVDLHCYGQGQDSEEQKAAKDFLKTIGVKEVSPKLRMRSFLERRYREESRAFCDEDLKHFVDFVKSNPSDAYLLSGYRVIMRQDGKWCKPSELYLDIPFLETGLSIYYQSLEKQAGIDVAMLKGAIHPTYENRGIAAEQIGEFFSAIGVKKDLDIVEANIKNNPNKDYLDRAYGYKNTTGTKSNDYTIPGLERVLEVPSTRFSMLLWKTMQNLPPHLECKSNCYSARKTCPKYLECAYLYAHICINESTGRFFAPSQLVHILSAANWVPQLHSRASIDARMTRSNGEPEAAPSIVFVRPTDADSGLLPEGFLFNSGAPWIRSVNFGERRRRALEEERRKQEDTARKNLEQKKQLEQKQEELTKAEEERNSNVESAKKLGFKDEASLKRAQEFSQLPEEDQNRILRNNTSPKNNEADACPLPNSRTDDPSRRSEAARTEARSAPVRTKETRERSVSMIIPAVKELTEPYLRQEYTNENGQMICQICQKELPFRISKPSLGKVHFFEATEFLKDLSGHHIVNYLALCPNHGAMFVHANPNRSSIMQDFLEMDDKEGFMKIHLADHDLKIYFTSNHIADLRGTIRGADERTKEE